MTQTFGPFNAGAGSSFNAQQWRELFGNLVSSGVLRGGSVNGVASNDLAVTGPGTGLVVNVGTGVACVYGFYYENDAVLPQTINAADPTYGRVDYVVLQLLYASNSLAVAVLPGVPSTTPTAPALTQTSTTWQVPLATVAVAAGATVITNAQVTDARVYAGEQPPAHQGQGSLLNADLLDGLDSSTFVLGATPSQHIIVLNRTPTNADGANGDIIIQW